MSHRAGFVLNALSLPVYLSVVDLLLTHVCRGSKAKVVSNQFPADLPFLLPQRGSSGLEEPPLPQSL